METIQIFQKIPVEIMNISRPETNSEVYRQFLGIVNQKVSAAANWLASRDIDYVWNYWANGHLYRLYIPSKDLLLDFEWYPVNNYEYDYIRINFDTDIIRLLEQLFPNIIFETQELEVWKLNQMVVNKFLRENGASPVYDKNVLRLGYVKDGTIYKCMILQGNKIIRNVNTRGCSIPLGTFMLLRQFNEAFCVPEILSKETTGNSFMSIMYQTIHATPVSRTDKKKIWWSPSGAKWKIKKEQTLQFIPFYYCGDVVYKYPGEF